MTCPELLSKWHHEEIFRAILSDTIPELGSSKFGGEHLFLTLAD